MVKIKITVQKIISPDYVFGHEIRNARGEVVIACNRWGIEEGKEWIISRLQKPENFCSWAWHDLYKNLSILYFGGGWNKDNSMYTACSDGKRPVIFKLEKVES